jgi:NADH-quinone oxidoreductase subunit J
MDSVLVPMGVGCAVALGSALAVVLARRPIYAAIALLVHSLSLAGLYAMLSAGLVAVGQLIIYSGAIVVLFLFVVTLLPAGGREFTPTGGRVAAACVAGGGLIVALAAALASGALPSAVPAPDLSVAAVGHALFGPLLVAFELTAPLLLVAIVAAVVIWRRHEPRPRTAVRTQVSTPRRLVMHR